MVIYHDNPGIEIERASSIAEGATANVSRVTMGAHTGTHIDGPLHFFEDGSGADELPLEAMVGPALVVELARDRRPGRSTPPRSRPPRSPPEPSGCC